MNFTYQQGWSHLLRGNDYEAADIRVLLLETDDEDPDYDTIDALLAGDAVELSSTDYEREAATGETIEVDDVQDQTELHIDDVTFDGTAGNGINQAGSEQAVAAVVYIHLTDDTDSIPLAHLDDGGFPITPNGSDITIQWDADGFAYIDTMPA